jgi:hypothetical protein
MMTDDQPLLDLDIRKFIDSINVTRLDFKQRRAQDKPRFNVYADSSHIRDPRIWSQVRDFMATQLYSNTRIGEGKTVIAPNNCGICHGADHPRGLCPFPDVPGWNGPLRTVGNQRNRNGNRQGDSFASSSRGWN